MKLLAITTLAPCAFTAMATRLLVADYGGNVTTLTLSETNGTYSLQKTAASQACAPNPSWLTIDAGRGEVYCLNEGLYTVNGSLSSLLINEDGSLKAVQNTTTPSGPVSGIIYGTPSSQQGIVLAHYSGSAVSSWLLDGKGNFSKNQELFYTLEQPGPDPERQDAPHNHEAITDPTGKYILVPDLGADLVRVYKYDQDTLELKALESLKAEAGSGPRHAAFYTPSSVSGATTYFYLVAELAATVTAYKVTYTSSGLTFTHLQTSPTIPLFNTARRVAPAGIAVSPDNRFLIISNRNDTSFTLPTLGKSDSLSTFSLDPQSGNLTLHQLWPAGGNYPRHFELNAVGDLVAVGLQNDQAVTVLKRDVGTGLVGEPVARWQTSGNVTFAGWYEGVGGR
ncbi:hypothetical protein DOTSEDRAFT_57285 [Lecanosticta acicola]|uniref:6-phosphogluconolactonase n=1 Tax=Lecanosticta acicola TaxID=111012 RepID=A0AAI8W1J2_9PEZI|nr:hypothetical protein DOTSEDRAFT_57285 [Lecanosticta acicola]